jgi:hypothetical protein
MSERHKPRQPASVRAAPGRGVERDAGLRHRDLAGLQPPRRSGIPRRPLLLALALLAGALAPLSAQARPANTGFFASPSGNIVCLYLDGKGVPSTLLECGIKSGLRPAPPRTADCRVLDYVGNRVTLSASGHAQPVACAGDAGPFASPTTPAKLAYGSRWRGGGLSCTSQRSGLTCRNAAGHGFFLSRASWRSF